MSRREVGGVGGRKERSEDEGSWEKRLSKGEGQGDSRERHSMKRELKEEERKE